MKIFSPVLLACLLSILAFAQDAKDKKIDVTGNWESAVESPQGNYTSAATYKQEGETLTFGQDMFTWKQLYAAAGDYIVGYIIEDLDGNSQTSFVQVTVR